MKNQIPEFLKEKFEMKGSAQTKFFPEDIKQFMKDYANYYDWNLDNNLTKIFKAMKGGISELPICGYESCNNKVYFNWEMKLTKGCCQEHSLKVTYQEKYGVDSNFQLESTKKQIKETCKVKYGVPNPMQNDDVKNKLNTTIYERYGVLWASQHQKIKDKVKQTNIEKYGVNNPFSSEKIKTQIKETCKVKYGVPHPMQSPEIAEKSLKKSYSYKTYKWKSGEKSSVQGYEGKVLQELENQGYGFEDILTKKNDMPEIWYDFEGKKHRYFPDIFIPKENLIIEVKSKYTMDLHYERNLLKFEAVKKLGFAFKLEIR